MTPAGTSIDVQNGWEENTHTTDCVLSDQDYSNTIMCVCVFSPFILDIKFVGRTSRVHTQKEGHTGFFIHLLSAVRALIFLARRIQPFLSLVDREVEILCTDDLILLHSLGIFSFVF